MAISTSVFISVWFSFCLIWFEQRRYFSLLTKKSYKAPYTYTACTCIRSQWSHRSELGENNNKRQQQQQLCFVFRCFVFSTKQTAAQIYTIHNIQIQTHLHTEKPKSIHRAADPIGVTVNGVLYTGNNSITEGSNRLHGKINDKSANLKKNHICFDLPVAKKRIYFRADQRDLDAAITLHARERGKLCSQFINWRQIKTSIVLCH